MSKLSKNGANIIVSGLYRIAFIIYVILFQ